MSDIIKINEDEKKDENKTKKSINKKSATKKDSTSLKTSTIKKGTKTNLSNKVIDKKNHAFSIEELEIIKEKQEVLDMYVETVDDNLNLIGKVGKNIKAIIPRDESSSIVGDDGHVDEKHISNKTGKIVQACITNIIKTDDSIEIMLSRKKLELKVRKWMYMHLKPGIKLRGIVRGMNDFAAFVDVGGGVSGILKISDITDIHIQKVSEALRIGQRLQVLVKNYDRDTGRIELSTKEFMPTFEKLIKGIKEGDIIDGIIRNRTKTGIFVSIKPNLIGLAEHVNGLEYGQKVLVSVKKIIPEKKKIKLIIIG